MNIPNYFLADLPPEATLSGQMIADACLTLKRNRAQYLAQRATQSLIKTLVDAGQSWLDPEFHFRKLALAADPRITGFPPATLATGLDALFKQFTRENFEALIIQEFAHLKRLDELSATNAESQAQRAAMVHGPELVAHIGAGNLPVPQLMNMTLGLLARASQFVKCASGGAFIPRLYAHSLYELEPKLGACIEVAEWPGGTVALEEPLFRESDLVTATGADETLGEIRRRLPLRTRFLGYGHRVSFGYVTHEVLTRLNTPRVITRAVTDLTAWNQHGCLSPHVFYVEHGGHVSVEQFAEALAAELDQREGTHPRGHVELHTATAITKRRGLYEVRAAHSSETRVWSSKDSTAWTVVYESDPRFQVSCLNRFVYVKG
ncbi:MAG TPA: acyl-CoA reductase, partial [Verrucomicrobiae bacterium]|nr:acyl-CoA reductase [Verrucomicrobiae bacterium]